VQARAAGEAHSPHFPEARLGAGLDQPELGLGKLHLRQMMPGPLPSGRSAPGLRGRAWGPLQDAHGEVHVLALDGPALGSG